MFVASAAVGLLALLAWLALPSDREAGGDDDDDDDVTFKEFVGIFRDRTLLPVYAMIVVNMFLVSILFGFLPLYLHGLGFSPLRTGAIVTAVTASYLVVQPIAGYLADVRSIRITVIVGMVLAATAIVEVTFVTLTLILVLLATVAGAGVGTVWTNTDALGALDGATMGAAQSFKELGDMIGPLAIGALTQLAGLRVGFVVCSVLALVLLGALSASPALRFEPERE